MRRSNAVQFVYGAYVETVAQLRQWGVLSGPFQTTSADQTATATTAGGGTFVKADFNFFCPDRYGGIVCQVSSGCPIMQTYTTEGITENKQNTTVKSDCVHWVLTFTVNLQMASQQAKKEGLAVLIKPTCIVFCG